MQFYANLYACTLTFKGKKYTKHKQEKPPTVKSLRRVTAF